MKFLLKAMVLTAVGAVFLTGCQSGSPDTAKNTPANAPANAARTPESKPAANAAVPAKDGATAGTMTIENAPRITLAEAKKEFDAGNVVFVDTRAAVTFSQGHVKGAINVPMEAFEQRWKEIPTGKKIIAYCS